MNQANVSPSLPLSPSSVRRQRLDYRPLFRVLLFKFYPTLSAKKKKFHPFIPSQIAQEWHNKKKVAFKKFQIKSIPPLKRGHLFRLIFHFSHLQFGLKIKLATELFTFIIHKS